ncbi:MAG: MBL fold metallo-hydrolase [Clostridiales bacterium]|nr:MBL fold metallo-hydrolase [Clostridiales bacterium]
MLNNIKINCHSSIKIQKEKTIYIDPFRINEVPHDADFIFITHSHYDHFSPKDILKVAKIDTIFITVAEIKSSILVMGVPEEQIIIVEPSNEYQIETLKFNTLPAYNINEKFHPKENGWVGYLIELDNFKYYIAGDTDNVEELQSLNCDVAFLPIGGTFTMNYEEAAKLANKINAKAIVPTHYGELVGTNEDLENFIELTEKNVNVLINN